MNAPDQTPATAPLGAPMLGGFLIGRFFLGASPHLLIVAPKHEGEIPRSAWHKAYGRIDGALSDFDGLANTRAMAEDGSPLAVKILGLKLAGGDDWYLPSRGELLLAWSARESLPEAERFEKDWYWSSTQFHLAGYSDYAWGQGFSYGHSRYWHKVNKPMARAVRRVAI